MVLQERDIRAEAPPGQTPALTLVPAAAARLGWELHHLGTMALREMVALEYSTISTATHTIMLAAAADRSTIQAVPYPEMVESAAAVGHRAGRRSLQVGDRPKIVVATAPLAVLAVPVVPILAAVAVGLGKPAAQAQLAAVEL